MKKKKLNTKHNNKKYTHTKLLGAAVSHKKIHKLRLFKN